MTGLNPSLVTVPAWDSGSPAISKKETKRMKVYAMLAAILLPCAAIASPPVIKPSSGFNSQSVFMGASAAFTITATGDAPFVYQWRQDDAVLPGQTNRSLRIGPTQPANEGGYDVVVSNASGSVTSYVARLFAVPPTSELTRSNHTNAARLRLPYVYHHPTGYDPARRYPLILVFTGGGIDEANLFSAFPAQFWVHTSYARQAADPSVVVYVTRRAGDANGSWTPQYLEQTAALLEELGRATELERLASIQSNTADAALLRTAAAKASEAAKRNTRESRGFFMAFGLNVTKVGSPV